MALSRRAFGAKVNSRRSSFVRRVICLAAALWSSTAEAQRTTDNVVTESGDAFGQTIGRERSGLYSSEDVRGFNPVDAGNARIEGLYFDQIDRLPGRIVDASRIRVGLSTIGFAFPAPTGLVDYRLTKPNGRAEGSFEIQTEDLFGPGLSIEGMVPVDGVRLALSGGAGVRHFHHPEGGGHHAVNYGAALAYRPFEGAEFLAFGGGIRSREEEARPTLFPTANFLPPRVSRRSNLRQPWTDRNTNNTTYGAIAFVPLGAVRLETGIFRTRRTTLSAFADIMSGVSPDGFVERRTIVADRNSVDQSLSGEFRLVRQWATSAFTHRLMLSARGRHKQRLFGGSQRLSLGTSTTLQRDIRIEPPLVLGMKNDDDVVQLSGGVSYSFAWNQRATLDLGLSKTYYRKRVDFADPLLIDPVTRDYPLTWNILAAYEITPGVRVFGGATQGQEEALIAPDIAINRSEAPPAIDTRQVEAGVRVAISPRLSLLAGVFSITKPYFNLDPGFRYRQLGDVSNRGAEVSLTGQVLPGVTIVGGLVVTDPAISGESVETGLIGPWPVGQVKRRAVASLDWRSDGGAGPLSFDLKLESLSSRAANAQNTLFASGFSTVDVGARYRMKMGAIPLVARVEVLNVFNSYGWRVSSAGGFTYSNPRTLAVSVVGDL